jgi:hypothetical protein
MSNTNHTPHYPIPTPQPTPAHVAYNKHGGMGGFPSTQDIQTRGSTSPFNASDDHFNISVTCQDETRYYCIPTQHSGSDWAELGSKAAMRVEETQLTPSWKATKVLVHFNTDRLIEWTIFENPRIDRWLKSWALLGERVKQAYELLWGEDSPPPSNIEPTPTHPRPSQEGTKHDQGKPKFSLIPQAALLEVAKVATFGAQKYGPKNWQDTKNLRDRYTDAALRHINAFLQGESHDAETELHHLSHAICSLMFVLDDAITKEQDDDYYVSVSIEE